MGMMDWLRSSLRPKVRVPPGHKVVVVGPSPDPVFTRLESGLGFADFGSTPAPAHQPLFDAAERQLRLAPRTPILWSLQEKAVRVWLSDVDVLTDWLWRFHQVRHLRGAEGGDLAVLPDFGPRARLMMDLLQSLGVVVHLPGPDGKILCEVHRPDGSTVLGMLGAAVPGETGRTLQELYAKRIELENSPGPEEALAELKARERSFLRNAFDKRIIYKYAEG